MNTTNNLMHADIFFFITAIAVVLLTLILIVILFYVARAVRTVSHLVDKIKGEGEQVIDDLSDLREKLKESGSQVSGLGKWFLTMILGKAASSAYNRAKAKKSTSKKTKGDTDDME